MEQTKRTVYQIDPKTESIVAEYPTVTKAARALGCTTQGIYHVLRNERKTAKGYIWEWSNVK